MLITECLLINLTLVRSPGGGHFIGPFLYKVPAAKTRQSSKLPLLIWNKFFYIILNLIFLNGWPLKIYHSGEHLMTMQWFHYRCLWRDPVMFYLSFDIWTWRNEDIELGWPIRWGTWHAGLSIWTGRHVSSLFPSHILTYE